MTLPILNGLNNRMKTGRSRRNPRVWITAAVLLGLYLIQEASISDVTSNGSAGPMPESLVVYDWKDPEMGAMKQHMELVHMETDLVRRKGYFPIDQVHRNGWFHTAVITAVLHSNVADEQAKILLVKRGPQLVTCPDTWSLVGEHTYRDETPKETVQRGLLEELGDDFLNQFLKAGTLKPLLKHPVLFHLDYHDHQGRMERSPIYIYVIEMNSPLEELQKLLKVEDEAAEVRWMTRQEIQDDWMNYHPKRFCHHEMAVFMQLMLHRIEDLGKQARKDTSG